MKEIVVTGSRHFENWELVHDGIAAELWVASEPIRIILGDCPTGADLFATQFSYAISITTDWDFHYETFHADWEKYGKAAGPKRNHRMCDSVLDIPAAVCLAFPDAQSRGTKDCATYADELGIRVSFPEFKDQEVWPKWLEWGEKLGGK